MEFSELVEIIDCIPSYEDLHASYMRNLQRNMLIIDDKLEVKKLKQELVNKRIDEIKKLLDELEGCAKVEWNSDKSEIVTDFSEEYTDDEHDKLKGSVTQIQEDEHSTSKSCMDTMMILESTEITSVPWYSPTHRPLLSSPNSKKLLEEIQSPLPPVSPLSPLSPLSPIPGAHVPSSTSSSNVSCQSPLIRYGRSHGKVEMSTSFIAASTPQQLLPTLRNTPIAYDEIFWEFRYQSSCSTSYSKITHTKLFFFQSSLWRITFGPSTIDPSYYCVYLSPGEHVVNNSYLQAAFYILPSEVETTAGMSIEPDSMIADRIYQYPAGQVISYGFDQFVHRQQLLDYISPHGTLRLCVELQAYMPSNM